MNWELRKLTPTFNSRWRHRPTIACLSPAWKSSKLTCVYQKWQTKVTFKKYISSHKALVIHTKFLFFQEYNNLNGIHILKLRYAVKLINSTIHNFGTLQTRVSPHQSAHLTAPLRVTIPTKDQKSADVVRRRLRDLGRQINLLFHDSISCNARTHLFCKCNVKYVNNWYNRW